MHQCSRSRAHGLFAEKIRSPQAFEMMDFSDRMHAVCLRHQNGSTRTMLHQCYCTALESQTGSTLSFDKGLGMSDSHAQCSQDSVEVIEVIMKRGDRGFRRTAGLTC
ncbi:hypothetical protein AcV5_005269 [Taiwanofungus camphoratus]|nr:hypothetical protein AcW2_000125 [Antrodia cinnamomea]KAI0937339.1 hypothetical protein AcV5_005269 [Antrodia cinnamomea]KAI0962552.1 hypothetical protein AcV7_001371 [Antrodia cinnamomea]